MKDPRLPGATMLKHSFAYCKIQNSLSEYGTMVVKSGLKYGISLTRRGYDYKVLSTTKSRPLVVTMRVR